MVSDAARQEPGPVRRTALLAAAYALTGFASGFLALPPGYASAVWPPAGIALVAALLWGRAAMPGILLGSALLNIVIGLETETVARAVVAALLIAVGACLQALVGALLTERILGPGNPVEQGGSVPLFLLVGGPVACLVNPVWSGAWLVALGKVPPHEGLVNAATWWVGDSIGVLLFAPLMLAWLGSPTVWTPRRWASLVVPLGASLAGVVALFVQTSRWTEQNARATFESRAQVVAASFFTDLRRAEAYTESTARVFGALPTIERRAFRAMVDPWLRANPAVQAFEWAPSVPRDTLAAFEASAADDEVRDYHVSELDAQGALRPVNPAEAHTPILYIEPMRSEAGAVGYDLSSHPARRRAIAIAQDTGGVAMTDPVRLVLYPDEWGVLFVAAAYGGAEPPRDLVSRRAEMRGIVAAVVRVEVAVESALRRPPGNGLSVRVSDLSFSPARILAGAATPAGANVLTWSATESIGGRPWQIEVIARAGANGSWLGWSVLAVGLAATGLVVAFVLDAGARAIQVERLVGERTAALARANEALTRSNLELQRFAYVASHDMREPLRTIACFTELLERDQADRLDEDGRAWLRRVGGATRRMQDLVSDLLAFARSESHVDQLARVPIEEAARAALDDLDAAMRSAGAEVVFGPLPAAWCDRIQLVQLFQNLFSNAIKFRRPGVPVRVEVTATRTPDGVEVAVQDNGIGIDPRHWERVFEMFQTLHAPGRYPGHGIGLATCRRMVERHGGRIWVVSEPGQGSVFHFTLPDPP